MREVLPLARIAQLKKSVAVREKRSTFSLAPDAPPRPHTRTAIEGLLLAGDWIETGLPATIESAVISGRLAATAAEATRGPLEALSRLIVKPDVPGSDTLEGLVREMLRPMLREWLDANLPRMVEEMVQREIARITAAREAYAQDRQYCLSGRSPQDQQTCLREAGAALQGGASFGGHPVRTFPRTPPARDRLPEATAHRFSTPPAGTGSATARSRACTTYRSRRPGPRDRRTCRSTPTGGRRWPAR